MKHWSKAPSPALVISLIALFVALGGTTYAATSLPQNSVGTKQLRKNAVVSSKAKNHSLLGADFKAGQLPVGPRGPKGDTGAPGPAGPTASAYAYAQNQNGFVFVDSGTDTTAVQLTGSGGSPVTAASPRAFTSQASSVCATTRGRARRGGSPRPA